MSLQRRIGPIFRGSAGDTFNLAYDNHQQPHTLHFKFMFKAQLVAHDHF
jgi:hypothetical protein